MNRHARSLLLAAVCGVILQAQAQDLQPLSRDEVSVFKKKLVAVFESLGKPPAGYSMEHESYNLPTDASGSGSGGKYYLTHASADREYGSAKDAQAAQKDLEKEYKKKILEAQAKGDYEAVGKIAQEMQTKMSQLALETEEGSREPITIYIGLNDGTESAIDPDAVLHEQSGAIALKTLENDDERGEVHIYFDPVSLKDTKQLSKVSLRYPDQGVGKKTTVLMATITFRGPSEAIDAWAKRIDYKKVLSQIDR